MPVLASDIENVIRTNLPVTHLEVVDESSGCGENYRVLIVSEAFEGKSTLARHRLINELLKAEISQIHAFTQKTLTPKQWAAEKP
ncbi:bola-like protein [Vararia minispora EC-137]|uniref:Bola-like protein n=1 Tax=Vararia minispora EC-137 TaxID=1314806 RepID=A0ACB8Q7B6_9AGAM|nr:bola-like protein [Vararia minispora EC-137]